jgi:hypothetical protein
LLTCLIGRVPLPDTVLSPRSPFASRLGFATKITHSKIREAEKGARMVVVIAVGQPCIVADWAREQEFSSNKFSLCCPLDSGQKS